MTTFAGRWMTSFGPMELRQNADHVEGTYGEPTAPWTLEGDVQGDKLVFRYQEPSESGEGWFELVRFGQFRGHYQPDGTDRRGEWTGQRLWDGIWETSFGRMRLIQEEERIHGFYSGAGSSRLEGRLAADRFVFRYFEPTVEGEGWFELSDDMLSFNGNWSPDGAATSGKWSGERVRQQRGRNWLMVFEAYWQGSFTESEYSYGVMLKEFFARVPSVAVRHRFFHDEGSLAKWCRDLMYVPEPSIVLISSHGTQAGVTVHGQTINPKLVVDSLRHAGNVQLLHFAACLVLQEDKEGDFLRRIETEAPFPISGYTTSVDWGGSAVSEFSYLDMILSKHLTPEDAASRLLKLVAYAGDETPAESPYAAAGFRFCKPGKASTPTKTRKKTSRKGAKTQRSK